MRLKKWPRTGAAKRLYVNHGGHWSVDAWFEPVEAQPNWRLRVKLSDAESERRANEIKRSIVTDVAVELERLADAYGFDGSISELRWLDLERLADRSRETRRRAAGERQ